MIRLKYVDSNGELVVSMSALDLISLMADAESSVLRQRDRIAAGERGLLGRLTDAESNVRELNIIFDKQYPEKGTI